MLLGNCGPNRLQHARINSNPTRSVPERHVGRAEFKEQYLSERPLRFELKSHERDHCPAFCPGFSDCNLEAGSLSSLALPVEDSHPGTVGHRFHCVQRGLDHCEGGRGWPKNHCGNSEDRLVCLEIVAAFAVLGESAFLSRPSEMRERIEIDFIPGANVLTCRHSSICRQLREQ